jgi:hypothetical protein
VKKWPGPSAVRFSSDTSSMVRCAVTRSPGRRYRKNSWSELVATMAVNPPSARTARRDAWPWSGPRASAGSMNPRMTHTSCITGGATIPPCTEEAANSGSVYTGLVSPMTSQNWRIMASLTASGATHGGRAGRPTNERRRWRKAS